MTGKKTIEKKQIDAMKMDILIEQIIATAHIIKADLMTDVRGVNEETMKSLGTAAGYLAQTEYALSHAGDVKKEEAKE